MFSVCFHCICCRNGFCLPRQNRFQELNLRYLGQRIYRSGEMYWMTFPWPRPKVMAVALIGKNLFVCMISENHSSDHSKHSKLEYWNTIEKIKHYLRHENKVNEIKYYHMCFFQDQTLFWPFLRNSWSDWWKTERKCIGWILGIMCDLRLWPQSWPWPWMFQVQISK